MKRCKLMISPAENRRAGAYSNARQLAQLAAILRTNAGLAGRIIADRPHGIAGQNIHFIAG